MEESEYSHVMTEIFECLSKEKDNCDSLSTLLLESPYLPHKIFSVVAVIVNERKFADDVLTALSRIVVRRPSSKNQIMNLLLQTSVCENVQKREAAIKIFVEHLCRHANLNHLVEKFAIDTLKKLLQQPQEQLEESPKVDIESNTENGKAIKVKKEVVEENGEAERGLEEKEKEIKEEKNEEDKKEEERKEKERKEEEKKEQEKREGEILAHLQLYLSLCPLRQELLYILVDLYDKFSLQVKKQVHEQLPLVIRKIGEPTQPLLDLILTYSSSSAQTLVLQIVNVLTESLPFFFKSSLRKIISLKSQDPSSACHCRERRF